MRHDENYGVQDAVDAEPADRVERYAHGVDAPSLHAGEKTRIRGAVEDAVTFRERSTPQAHQRSYALTHHMTDGFALYD